MATRSWLDELRCRHPVWLLLGVAFALRLVAVNVRFVIGTDEGLFLTLGQNLAGGLGFTGDGRTVQVDFPPGFSLYAALVYALGGGLELPSRLNVLLFGSLLVVPVYDLGRQLVNEPTGFRAGLFTALLPALVLAQGNFESVAEPLYTLLLFTGWALLWRGLARRQAWAFGLAGLALGAAHLVRWEGVVLGLIGAGFIALCLRRAAAVPVGLFLAGLALFALPYGAFLYRHTGSVVSPKARITQWHAAALEASAGDPFAYEKAYDAYDAFLADPRQPLPAPPSGVGGLARRYAANALTEIRLWLTSVSLMTVVWLVPALVGAWTLPRWRALFVALLFLPLALIPLSVVDPRYFLPALPAAMILAAHGWNRLADRLSAGGLGPARGGRLARWLVAGTLALFAAGALAGPFLFPRPLEYRAAGLAVRDALPAGAHMLARKRQVPFYAGAAWEWLPYGELEEVLAYAASRGADYLVVDEATTPELRPQLAHLLEPSAAPADLRPVYASGVGPRVVVYQIVR